MSNRTEKTNHMKIKRLILIALAALAFGLASIDGGKIGIAGGSSHELARGKIGIAGGN